jgi:hypothetical protein
MTEYFIERAKKIHNDKYNYSCVDYKNRDTNVSIICKIHGQFLQRPVVHLRGSGCKICKNELLSKFRNTDQRIPLSSESQFLKRSNKRRCPNHFWKLLTQFWTDTKQNCDLISVLI